MKKFVDGLINPKVYHKPQSKRRRRGRLSWRWLSILLVVTIVGSYVLGPKVSLLADQYELFRTLTNGRYLVLFQNDGEIRSSGGFIGSFAVIEAKDNTVKPLYFETNIYKLDNPFTAQTKLEPPLPIKQVLSGQGWAMRDSNFAADFRQSAQSVEWFFTEETKKLTGTKKAEIDRALGGNYEIDGVIATNMSAFLDLLEVIGPITIPQENITVNKDNFFPVVQQVVERDYFKDPANKVTNEPKTILQNLFPIAMNKAQTLPKTTQYKLITRLLREKKVLIYSDDAATEQVLIDRGWGGALTVPADLKPEGKSDFLAVVRSSHGGNKSSLDMNPIFDLTVDAKGEQVFHTLEISMEHTGTGTWPSGVNYEYVRVLVPDQASLAKVTQNGEDITAKIDVGKESGRAVFGFWMRTEPKSTQSITLEYAVSSELIKGSKYQLEMIRQPGGNSPDLSVIYNGKQIHQARLHEDRIITQ